MSIFSTIAVLHGPSKDNPDWSFEMEGLQFEVHDGMMELKQSMTDLDHFCASICAVETLLDNIDLNKGRLDEAVFTLVNQNNELAEALGIFTPFSFATEEGQEQAGQEVKEAAQSGDNKSSDANKQGFFAKAWEAIKKFFKSIGSAISKAWGAISGNGTKGVDNAVSNMTETINNTDPSKLDEAFKITIDENAHTGLKYTKDEITQIATAISKAAKDIHDLYPNGNFQDIANVIINNDAVFLPDSVEALITALHYKVENDRILPVDVTPSQKNSLLEYGIDVQFCKSFATTVWAPVKQAINALNNSISGFEAAYGKVDDATLKAFVEKNNLQGERAITIMKTNFNSPKRGINAMCKRHLGNLLKKVGMEKKGSKIEASGYRKNAPETMTANLGEDAINKCAGQLAATGQLAAVVLNALLKVTQITLKDMKSFVETVDSTIKQVTSGVENNKKKSAKAISDYNNKYHENQAEQQTAGA